VSLTQCIYSAVSMTKYTVENTRKFASRAENN
jgi:hypothetical protein